MTEFRMNTDYNNKPLVYSCSGCSSVAQLANDLAVILDREGSAQMSCIAGVGGQVKQLVKVAQSGRPILAVDGCPLNCVKQTLATVNVVPTWHIELTSLGYKKRDHENCDLGDAYKLLQMVHSDILSLAGAMNVQPS
jgi:uncharacterized metal-binding protein